MQIKNIIYLALFAGVAGCATLPSSGPTGRQIEKSATAPQDGSTIQIVEIQKATDVPVATGIALPASLLSQSAPEPTDMVGAGDIIEK